MVNMSWIVMSVILISAMNLQSGVDYEVTNDFSALTLSDG